MNKRVQLVIAGLLAAAFAGGAVEPPAPGDPIKNEALEQILITNTWPDGGLPLAPATQNFGVFRATRAAPELADGRGWTYNHHVDLAAWRGRLYLAWTNGERDGDVWPSREVYSTSTDGVHWTPPAELFPDGVSTSLRMHFYRARNGLMLAVAGLRTGNDKLSEDALGGLVVREIRANHTLGPPYILQDAPNYRPPMLPLSSYKTSNDQGFLAACTDLLGNRLYLEQQDHGVLLGDKRMGAYQGAPENFGKAFSFFRRQDGALVGVGQHGWTVVSKDNGKTWSAPVRPRSMDTGDTREWVQRTSDGRYACVFIPQENVRYPLVVITGDDGVTFKDMRVIHGEVPRQRYAGENKNPGPQDARGISEWDTDLSWPAAAMWIAYSVNGEDIWVARVPVPMLAAEPEWAGSDFEAAAEGGHVPGWNTYAPKWCVVEIAAAPAGGKALRLEDHDPDDYARAQRVFPESAKISAVFRVQAQPLGAAPLEIELLPAFGAPRPVRLVLNPNGTVTIGRVTVAQFESGKWLDFRIEADAAAKRYTVFLNGEIIAPNVPFAQAADSLARINFRTGPWRGVGEGPPPAPDTDTPASSSSYFLDDIAVSSSPAQITPVSDGN